MKLFPRGELGGIQYTPGTLSLIGWANNFDTDRVHFEDFDLEK